MIAWIREGDLHTLILTVVLFFGLLILCMVAFHDDGSHGL